MQRLSEISVRLRTCRQRNHMSHGFRVDNTRQLYSQRSSQQRLFERSFVMLGQDCVILTQATGISRCGRCGGESAHGENWAGGKLMDHGKQRVKRRTMLEDRGRRWLRTSPGRTSTLSSRRRTPFRLSLDTTPIAFVLLCTDRQDHLNIRIDTRDWEWGEALVG
jgi:hypothetical protein